MRTCRVPHAGKERVTPSRGLKKQADATTFGFRLRTGGFALKSSASVSRFCFPTSLCTLSSLTIMSNNDANRFAAALAVDHKSKVSFEAIEAVTVSPHHFVVGRLCSAFQVSFLTYPVRIEILGLTQALYTVEAVTMIGSTLGVIEDLDKLGIRYYEECRDGDMETWNFFKRSRGRPTGLKNKPKVENSLGQKRAWKRTFGARRVLGLVENPYSGFENVGAAASKVGTSMNEETAIDSSGSSSSGGNPLE
ncbi:hypothetical protein ACLB2K_004741 [Fragaria x ananassa]